MKFENNKFRKLYLYLLILSMLFTSGTPMQSIYNIQFSIILFVISIIGIIINKESRYKINKNCMFTLIILVFILLFSMIINVDKDFTHYIGVILSILTAVIITNIMKFEEFYEIYINIMVCICAYSILIILYVNLNISFVGELPVFVSGNNEWHHIGIFQYFWGWSQWSTLVRNSAFFREPGVFGCYSSLAILFQIYKIKGTLYEKNRKRDIYKFIILLFGALTTISTTTIICVILCILIYFNENMRITKKNIFVSILFLIIASYYFNLFSNKLFSKFNQSNDSFVSFKERMDGIITGGKCFLNNPLFGSGYTEYKNAIKGTSANSFIDVLGKYGIITFLFLFIGIINITNKIEFKTISRVLFLILLIIILSTQNLLIYPIFLSLSFFGLKKI